MASHTRQPEAKNISHQRKATTARMVMLALITGAIFLMSGGNAKAWTPTYSGCRGGVGVPKTIGYRYWNGFGNSAAVYFPDRYVSRAPCYTDYTQYITITYRTWVFNLSTRQWQQLPPIVLSGSLSPNSPQLYVPTQSSTPTGWMNISVDAKVEWKLSNGYLVGSTYVNYDTVNDYTCYGCTVYRDATMGAYMHFEP